MTRPRRKPFAAIVTVSRDGRIRTLPQRDARDLPLFRITDFRAAMVAARVLCTQARHARMGFGLFVPGVPEADSEAEAVDAVLRFHDRVAARLARRIPARHWASLRRAA